MTVQVLAVQSLRGYRKQLENNNAKVNPAVSGLAVRYISSYCDELLLLQHLPTNGFDL